MAKAVEYQTSNRYVRYPFADDSMLSSSEETGLLIFGCFIDALIQLKKKTEQQPFITGIELRDHTLLFSLVGESNIRLTCTRSRKKFPVIQGETDWCWYTFVLSSDGIRLLEGRGDVKDVYNDQLFFSSRCIGTPPSVVDEILGYSGTREYEGTGERLSLQDALVAGADFAVSGDVCLSEGYNSSISVSESEISINAIPGEGLGTAPCPCTPDSSKNPSRGIWSSDGHVRIFNDTCYDLVHDSQLPEGQVRVNVKCKACCTCDMYADIVNQQLVPLRDSILHSKYLLDKTFNEYEDAVTKWNERLQEARPEDIDITMTAIPLDSAGTNIKNGTVSGKMNRCAFTVNIRNNSFVDVRIGSINAVVTGGAIRGKTLNYIYDRETITRNNWDEDVILQPGKILLISYFALKDDFVKRTYFKGDFHSCARFEAYSVKTGKSITRKTDCITI